MRELLKDKKIKKFLIELFFDFLRTRDLLTTWLVHIHITKFFPMRKRKANDMKSVFRLIEPWEWVNRFIWNDTPQKYIGWVAVDRAWRTHVVILILIDIYNAYRYNFNNVKLPTATVYEAVYAFIELYKSDKWTDTYSMTDLSKRETDIDQYISWFKTDQGYLYWARIHNAICPKNDMRFVREIEIEDNEQASQSA
jgi:hypothetical protein